MSRPLPIQVPYTSLFDQVAKELGIPRSLVEASIRHMIYSATDMMLDGHQVRLGRNTSMMFKWDTLVKKIEGLKVSKTVRNQSEATINRPRTPAPKATLHFADGDFIVGKKDGVYRIGFVEDVMDEYEVVVTAIFHLFRKTRTNTAFVLKSLPEPETLTLGKNEFLTPNMGNIFLNKVLRTTYPVKTTYGVMCEVTDYYQYMNS